MHRRTVCSLLIAGCIATAGLDRAFAITPLPLECADQRVYLVLAAPGALFLVDDAPTLPARFVDVVSLRRSGGNPWKIIGVWDAFSPLGVECTLTALGDLSVWLGLRNSDDQGTRFDVKAELLVDGAVMASGVTSCVAGVTRNPLKAKEVTVAFDPFPPVLFDGVIHDVALRISARIGTPTPGTCGGHASATGLRLYYDGATRPAGFDMQLVPN